ncbi:MAG: PH domain-containing protein [bacterium]|nr:PH domain-containing protein [bacterium]
MIKLLENEKIILIQRKHWFVIVAEGLPLFLIACIPLAVIITLITLFPITINILLQYWEFTIFYSFGWLMLVWMLFFIAWTNYYLDTLLVTTKRIIDIEQIGLFTRDIAELRLESIQDIKVEVVGLIHSFFKMGNLNIQTAGQNKEVSFKNIPNAYEVKNTISKCYDEILKESVGFRMNHQG